MKLETIVGEALQLSLHEREAYLDRACGQGSSLRLQVQSLLSSDPSIRTSLLLQAAGLTLLTTPAEVLPIELERYRLEARIGEGSYGVVYRGTQHTPVKRNVAVK